MQLEIPPGQERRRLSTYSSGPRVLGTLDSIINLSQSTSGLYGSPSCHSQLPEKTVWMPAPPPLPNCPPGLEYLSQMDRLLVRQKVEILEILTGYETCNRYEVKNDTGQRVYYALEENNFCTLFWCGAARPFTVKIFNNVGHEIIQLRRPLRCSRCCFPCCLQKLEVQAPPGTPIGYVIQNWDPCLPKFTLQNEAHQNILKIVGPFVVCGCGENNLFDLMSLDEDLNVGRISKLWAGLVKEMFTDADDIGVQFPPDLDIKMKAVTLAAAFLIDFLYFEHSHESRQRIVAW